MSTATNPIAPSPPANRCAEGNQSRVALAQAHGDIEQTAFNSSDRLRMSRQRLRRIGGACLRPTTLLVVLLAAHLGTRLWLHRTSPLSGAHNFDRTYGVSMSLMAGRGFHDLAVDESPASAPLREFFELKRSRISREEFAAYLASKPDPTRDPKYEWYMPLASTRIADVHLAALLWQVFGIDRRVLAAFYSLFSVATCACVFLIARRLTGSGWAGLIAAALVTVSPIEGFLNTWSWRDSSPMWFAAASLAWFTCGLERARRPAVNCIAYFVLGVLAVAGIGWRIDALVLAPFLAGAVLIRLIAARVGWRHLVSAVGCFLAGAVGTRAAILALGPPQVQTSNIGYHMAFYSDYERCRLLSIENSFQVQFSDADTLDQARQIDSASHPAANRLLPYLLPEYCAVCRGMFLELLRYNAFHWVSRAPIFYFEALGGLASQSMIFEAGSRQIQKDLRSPLRQCFSCGDWLEQAMPYLFLMGVLATCCVGGQRLTALLVALFSVYYAGIMFLVLPDQKHLGMLLVPLYVFAGAGIWGAARLLARSTCHGSNQTKWPAAVWRVTNVVLIAAAAWSMACLLAHSFSVERREELLREIQQRAAKGADSPETLRGGRNFAVSIRPDSSAEAAGYLLKIAAGDHPGVLVCRQLYFPRDWATIWGRELITRHPLCPNREQSFFVSCLQGSRLGDPCPHLCAVAIEGEGQILQSTRVDMSDWNHPQFCTLFYDGQRSPGSPVVGANPTDWLYVVGRPFSDPSPDKVRTERGGLGDVTTPIAAADSAGRPLRHMIARNTDTGLWKIAISDGWKFRFAELNYWSPTKNWLQLKTGDFNGDGMFDLVGQAPDGQWWLAMANGGYHQFQSIDALPRDVRYDFIGVGDFNGDGLDDLILRSTDGRWTLALSTGDGFHCRSVDGLPSATAPQNILIGDFLGNGRSRLAALDPRSGRWTIASFDGAKWNVRPWGEFPSGVEWRHPIAADFCGTGQADVAAWDPATGSWTVGRHNGNRLVAKPFGTWQPGKTWKCVRAGKFGAGPHAGLAAIDGVTGELNIAVSDGRQFTTRRYPGHAALAEQFYVGAFSGQLRDELLGVAADGELWVGTFQTDGGLQFKSWGRWPDRNRFTDFRSVGFWPGHQSGR
jgi:hypothetical protein